MDLMNPSPTPGPGWYPDPYGDAPLRWWDGANWTTHLTGVASHAPSPVIRFLRGLPWPAWIACLAVLSVVGFVCFGIGESGATPNPGAWYVVGFLASALVVLVSAALTLGRRRWREAAVLAFLAAAVVGFAIFVVSSPSTSRSCNNAGQPASAGTYDCDTSYGIGGPVMVAAFFVPSLALVALGKASATVIRRLW